MTDSDSVEFSADGSRAFMTVHKPGSSWVTTTITDVSSGAVVGHPITVNEDHSGFRYNDDGTRLYLYESLGNSSKVTIIDTVTAGAAEPIFVDGSCPRLTFSDDGTRAIVTTTGGEGIDDLSRVAFIDVETGELVSGLQSEDRAPSASNGAQPQGQQ